MVIKNGLVFENGRFIKKDLFIEAGRIVAEASDESIIDAEGLYVLPGFVDIHTHGCVGCDFSNGSADELHKMAKYQKSVGVTSFCPTSMTLPISVLEKAYENVDFFVSKEDEATVLGINMEGPFINPNRAGAQNKSYICRPSESIFERLSEMCDFKITHVTVAPEVPGALDFIEKISKETVVSIGHTEADFDVASEAFKRGASHVTHLCNAMPPLAHRDPSVFGAAADNEDVFVEVICDGEHIHPSMIRRIVDVFGDERVVLVSDSCEACGMPDGNYSLGGQPIKKAGNRASLADGTLAGSVTNLADCFRKAVEFGIPLESAVKMASENPAKSIGKFEEIGSLEPGKRADIILLDSNLELVKII